MNKLFTVMCLAMFSVSAGATDWSKRLKPTTDIETKDEEVWSTFDVNCEGPFVQIKTEKYKPANNQNTKAEHIPQTECLGGIFKNAIYHKRGPEDPIAYKTIDGKPYLEFYFSAPGKYVQKNVPLKKYAVKLAVHDFKGKGKYPIYHQNETFKPMLDKDHPITLYNNLIPMINYSKGRHIPVIMGNFAVFRDAELIKLTRKERDSGQYLDDKHREKNVSYTYTSGDRIYGKYSQNDMKKIMSGNKKLGEIVITDINKQGIITGSFKVRMLRESCNDILMIADCQISSVLIKGKFDAAEFKPNKDYIKKGLLKPKMKMKLKPKLGSNSNGTKPRLRTPSSSETIFDPPQPRLHKPLLGSQCKRSIANACKSAETAFQSYLSCQNKYNFKKNDAQDTASKNLKRCYAIYENDYTKKSKQCRKLFVEDATCTK